MAKVNSEPALRIVYRTDTVKRDDGFYYRKIYVDDVFVREYCIGRASTNSSLVPRGTQLELFPDAQTKF